LSHTREHCRWRRRPGRPWKSTPPRWKRRPRTPRLPATAPPTPPTLAGHPHRRSSLPGESHRPETSLGFHVARVTVRRGRRAGAVGFPFKRTAQKPRYPFGYYEAPTGGPRLLGPLFFSPPASGCAAGPVHAAPLGPASFRSAQFFFRNCFNLCLKSADFKFKYLLNHKSELGETCAKNSKILSSFH
jgi:hypothetical protein